MSLGHEEAIVFECKGRRLLGVMHKAVEGSGFGAIIVVGGPQYRVGSHRQFVLLARALSAGGIDVLRFDCRGMGDSEGEFPGFESLRDDIAAAEEAFLDRRDGVEQIVRIGLCDGASAILLSEAGNATGGGLILINPWVQTDSLQARAYVRHYYIRRLFELSFWKRVLSGKTPIVSNLREVFGKLRRSRVTDRTEFEQPGGDYVARMLEGFRRAERPCLLVLSGRDLTARQFDELCSHEKSWQQAVKRPNVSIARFELADHTFSDASDLDPLSRQCLHWIRSIGTQRT